MISGRDRRILADIERQMQAHDPELCDRFSGSGPGARGGALPHRATGTPAIIWWVLALVVALVLGMSMTSLVLVVAVIVVATLRVSRKSADRGAVRVGQQPHWPSPFGLPPFGPR